MDESGKRHALVIASQVRGLRGCHNDADLLAGLLGEFGFDVHAIRERTATRAGILGAYSELIQAAGPADAAVIYYAGHGSRTAISVRTAEDVRCILPTDIDESSTEDFRGILADELSVLQWRLTLRTPNVVTIFDCCYSGRMSRTADSGRPPVRGCDDRWPARAVMKRRQDATDEFTRLRAAHPQAEWFDANPHAVRLIACSPHQQAHEFETRSGTWHGRFTNTLASAVRENRQATWRAVCGSVQYRMLAQQSFQRPDAEGPIDRRLFSVDVQRPGRALPLRRDPDSGQAWIDGAPLHDLQVGDTFLLAAAGTDPTVAARRFGRITHLVGSAAALAAVDGEAIPERFIAHDDDVGGHDVRVRIQGAGAASVRASLASTPGTRIVEDDSFGDTATVTVTDAGCMLHDATGRPMYTESCPPDRAGITRLSTHIGQLAVSTRLLRLDLNDLNEPVSFEVTADRGRRVDRSVVHLGDEPVLTVAYGRGRSRFVYANVLDIGIAGRVVVLNQSEASSGVQLASGERRAIGEAPGGQAQGIGLFWPAGVPMEEPRPESFIAIFCDSPHDLRSLDQEGVAATRRHGARDVAPLSVGQRPARFTTRRVTFLLCPGGDACKRHH